MFDKKVFFNSFVLPMTFWVRFYGFDRTANTVEDMFRDKQVENKVELKVVSSDGN